MRTPEEVLSDYWLFIWHITGSHVATFWSHISSFIRQKWYNRGFPDWSTLLHTFVYIRRIVCMHIVSLFAWWGNRCGSEALLYLILWCVRWKASDLTRFPLQCACVLPVSSELTVATVYIPVPPPKGYLYGLGVWWDILTFFLGYIWDIRKRTCKMFYYMGAR